MNLPRMPGNSISGIKAATVVNTAAVTGAAVSVNASNTASIPENPRSTR